MARSKRVLDEADPNAEVAPSAKKHKDAKTRTRAKDASSSDQKAEAAPSAKKKNDANPRKVTKDASASDSNAEAATSVKTKEDTKSRSMAKDASSAEPVKEAVKSNREPPNGTSASPSKSSDIASNAPEVTWICLCRPTSDRAAELGIDSNDDEAEAIEETCGGGPKCLCRKPADEHPDHTWISTKKGFELVITWQQEQMKREPDAFGMYVYNDFAAYGAREVMGNMLLAFDTELRKGRMPLAIWSHIEGMAWHLNGDLFAFHMSDVPEANAQCLSLVGTALLTTLEVLIEHNLFIPATTTNPIRNIGLVLAQFIHSDTTVLRSEMCNSNETGWLIEVVKMADEHQVKIEGVFGIEERLQEIRDAAAAKKPKKNRKPPGEKKTAWTLSQDFNSQGMRLWRKWDWKRELAKYSSEWAMTPPHGGTCTVGGHNFDLSNEESMRRAKRWEKVRYGRESDEE